MNTIEESRSRFQSAVRRAQSAVATLPQEEETPHRDPTALREEITNIRLNPKRRAFEKKRAIAECVAKDLLRRGKLISAGPDASYFFDNTTKTLHSLDCPDFRSALHDRFGLNATESETKFLEQDLLTRARQHGQRAAVHHLAYWDGLRKRLHLSLHDGSQAILDGHVMRREPNGTDGVLFVTDREAEPVSVDLETTRQADRRAFHRLFDQLSLAVPEENPPLRLQMLALLKVWTLAIFFVEFLPVRPILTLLGEQGSGKTTLGRRLGLLLYGLLFEVSAFRSDDEQDFLAAITNKRLICYDNADAHIRWLPDHLARLATGSIIERRKLYTTNTLVTYRPQAFLMLTSRNPQWKRDDVARRLIPIRMASIEHGLIPERQLQQEVLTHRDEVWAALISILQDVVAAMATDPNTFTSTHRLADFHHFGTLAAPALGCGAEFESAMNHLSALQSDVLAENDDRVEAMLDWLGKKPDNWEESVASADLYAELKSLHCGPERTFPFKNPTALGSWLGRYRSVLSVKTGVTIKENRTKTGNRAWHFFRKDRCQGVKDLNPQEKKGVFNSDTLTPCFTEPVKDEDELFVEEGNYAS
jgi:hypothetical protein